MGAILGREVGLGEERWSFLGRSCGKSWIESLGDGELYM